ncbi:MAG: elongation factor Ts [bacterium]|nr:elongation factor Ts [bacterium]
MIEKIKQLRDETGASLGEIRSALASSGGDLARAKTLLAEKLGAIAAKKSGREVKAGVVDAYVHSNGRIGVLLELHCETDFVARNPEFRHLAHELAMHVAAMAPANAEELAGQEFIRDPGKKAGDLVREAVGKFGENIQIGNFTRFEL